MPPTNHPASQPSFVLSSEVRLSLKSINLYIIYKIIYLFCVFQSHVWERTHQTPVVSGDAFP